MLHQVCTPGCSDFPILRCRVVLYLVILVFGGMSTRFQGCVHFLGLFSQMTANWAA